MISEIRVSIEIQAAQAAKAIMTKIEHEAYRAQKMGRNLAFSNFTFDRQDGDPITLKMRCTVETKILRVGEPAPSGWTLLELSGQ